MTSFGNCAIHLVFLSSHFHRLTFSQSIRPPLPHSFSPSSPRYLPLAPCSSLSPFLHISRALFNRNLTRLPSTQQLRWLLTRKPLAYPRRVIIISYRGYHQPPYLASLLHFSNIPRQLRSSTSQQLPIPRTKLNLGKRAFSVAAPIIWNELPTTLKSCESLASFRKNLKTYLFKIAFPP